MRRENSKIWLAGLIGFIFIVVLTSSAMSQSIISKTTPITVPWARSGSTATHLSLWGTMIPLVGGLATFSISGVVIASTGLVVGPSLGYFYGGDNRRALTGIGIRSMLAGASVAGFALWTETGAENANAACVIFIAGGGLLMIDTIYYIVCAHKAVRDYNKKIEREHRASIKISPEYFGNQKAIGLKAQIKF